jgi:predicted ATPase with chaperone activity
LAVLLPVNNRIYLKKLIYLEPDAEFARPVLNLLRQPLETGQIVVARANHNVTYPARFRLAAAMSPCRCGYLGDPSRAYAGLRPKQAADCANARLQPDELAEVMICDDDATCLLQTAIEQSQLSAKAYQKVQRVAHSIADLKAELAISRATIAEALAYRAMPLLV